MVALLLVSFVRFVFQENQSYKGLTNLGARFPMPIQECMITHVVHRTESCWTLHNHIRKICCTEYPLYNALPDEMLSALVKVRG